jgi:iron complex transport system substrate-binding protein
VEIPETVKSIVCVNVGALRYTCYMQAQDMVVGVEDYEQKPGLSRLYNYVNFDKFSALPVIGTNGEHYPEAIIGVDPDVIIMTMASEADANTLQQKTVFPSLLYPAATPLWMRALMKPSALWVRSMARKTAPMI